MVDGWGDDPPGVAQVQEDVVQGEQHPDAQELPGVETPVAPPVALPQGVVVDNFMRPVLRGVPFTVVPITVEVLVDSFSVVPVSGLTDVATGET
jgi:hypothetical protein